MSNKTVVIIDQCGQDDLRFLVVDEQDIQSLDGVYIGTCAPDGRSDEDHDRMCDQVWSLISDESGEAFRTDLLNEFPTQAVRDGANVVVIGLIP